MANNAYDDISNWFTRIYDLSGSPRYHTTTPKTAAQIERERRNADFEKKDVRNGDVIMLKIGASCLQGKVTQVRKIEDGQWQVRIAGFDETPHGSHNNWFAVENAEIVEVLSRGFRWTPEDQIIAALAGLDEDNWNSKTEEFRESYRRAYGGTAKRVLAVASIKPTA